MLSLIKSRVWYIPILSDACFQRIPFLEHIQCWYGIRTRNTHKACCLNIYWHKKETSALHLCLSIPNECSYFILLFCFNHVDHLAMLCTKQKSIRWSLAPIITPQAPAQISKVTKSMSRVSSISLTVAVYPGLTERTHCRVVYSLLSPNADHGRA